MKGLVCFSFARSMVKGFDVAMDKRGGITEAENGDAFLELNRTATKYPHRYTKVSAFCLWKLCVELLATEVMKEGESLRGGSSARVLRSLCVGQDLLDGTEHTHR